MSLIRQHGSAPKAEIAQKTGLSAQAVTVIINSLEAVSYTHLTLPTTPYV